MLNLINAYIEKADFLCNVLRTIIPDGVPFLVAKNSKLIPRKYYICEVYYSFHGVGCYFAYPGGALDLDFGPDDRHDGFDLHRLRNFLTEMDDKSHYIHLLNEAAFNREFQNLIETGRIYKGNLSPSEHLYYLKPL